MLQIISGKFFTQEDRHIHDGKGITYSNYSWVRPISTCVAVLEPADTFGSVSSYVISYRNQIEKDGLLVRVGDSQIAEQFRLLCTFGLKAFFDQDRNAVSINCRAKPIDSSDRHLPGVFVPRFFAPEVRGTVEEEQAFMSLVEKVIGLPRATYRSVMVSLASFSQALTAINYNIDLSYSHLVYCLESLSQGFDSYAPSWEDYEDRVRVKLDKLLSETKEETTAQIKNVLLGSSHLGLRRRFVEFVLHHLDDAFFTNEAPKGSRSATRSELDRALTNAYVMRSGFVHRLAPIQEQLRLPPTGTVEIIHWSNEPYLTLSGLVRIAHSVILKFVMRQQSLDKEDVNWRHELPGTAMVELAPQYWVGGFRGFEPSYANQKLSGFLAMLETATLTGDALVSLQDLMAEYEHVLAQASEVERQSMLALHHLWDLVAGEEHKAPNREKLDSAYLQASDSCCVPMMVVKLLEGAAWPWSASACAEAWKAYLKSRYKKKGLRLTCYLELAGLLAVGDRYLAEGDEAQYKQWYHDALLDAAGRPPIQEAISDCADKRTSLSYQSIMAISKSTPAK